MTANPTPNSAPRFWVKLVLPQQTRRGMLLAGNLGIPLALALGPMPAATAHHDDRTVSA